MPGGCGPCGPCKPATKKSAPKKTTKKSTTRKSTVKKNVTARKSTGGGKGSNKILKLEVHLNQETPAKKTTYRPRSRGCCDYSSSDYSSDCSDSCSTCCSCSECYDSDDYSSDDRCYSKSYKSGSCCRR